VDESGAIDFTKKAAATVTDVLNSQAALPGDWITQVNLHYPSAIVIRKLVRDGNLDSNNSSDPIDMLYDFGRQSVRLRGLRFIIIIAEAVDDSITLSGSNAYGLLTYCRLTHSQSRGWAIQDSAVIYDGSAVRHPAAAVVRGIQPLPIWHWRRYL
jgi:hypothetical protein